MELRREDIPVLKGCDHFDAFIGSTRHGQIRVSFWPVFYGKGMHEIKVLALRLLQKRRFTAKAVDRVESDMRNFSLAPELPQIDDIEIHQSKSGQYAFLAAIAKQLHAQANTEQRLAGGDKFFDRHIEAGGRQRSHRRIESADTRENDGIEIQQPRRIRHHLYRGTKIVEGIDDRANIADVAVNDSEHDLLDFESRNPQAAFLLEQRLVDVLVQCGEELIFRNLVILQISRQVIFREVIVV